MTNREKIEEINSFKCIATTLSTVAAPQKFVARCPEGKEELTLNVAGARLLHGASDQRECEEHCHTPGVGSQERLLATSNGRTLAWFGYITRPLGSQR